MQLLAVCQIFLKASSERLPPTVHGPCFYVSCPSFGSFTFLVNIQENDEVEQYERVPLSNKSGIPRPVLNTCTFRPQKCNTTYFLAGKFLTCSTEFLTNFENSSSNPLQRP